MNWMNLKLLDATPLFVIFKDLSSDLQVEVLKLFADLASGILDGHEEVLTINLIHDIFFNPKRHGK